MSARRQLSVIGMVACFCLILTTGVRAEWWDDCYEDGGAPPLVGWAVHEWVTPESGTVRVDVETVITIDATSIDCGVKVVREYNTSFQPFGVPNWADKLGELAYEAVGAGIGAGAASAIGASITAGAAGSSAIAGGLTYGAAGGAIGGPIGVMLGGVVGAF